MTRKRPQRIGFRDAMDMVPDDMPDGAFFAMAHDIAGLDYGEGFDELAAENSRQPDYRDAGVDIAAIKKLLPGATVKVFNNGHHLKVNGRTDYWPKRQKWYDGRTFTKGKGLSEMAAFLKTKKKESQ